ncbi:PINc domain-containing protein [Mycena indigotica]|uniref:PINc domain-containing protein n=1 Tax=Mycena indigotica TaxID=2126181 RepID=A0A8H6VSN8_9AGAR|nr:PINc domain-containing protein [Mycena indigotica]KAF7290521.1 PINc domain-containing protein [Mycena indigotica]
MADKKAMSRALGAAFLNHQVEQLEKSAASRNWRSSSPNATQPFPKKRISQQQQTASAMTTQTISKRKKHAGVFTLPEPNHDTPSIDRLSLVDGKEKDANVVVVDASVLVHALHQVKRWCREGHSEIVIVPLEALNTLDLLKKGTSPIAQRARAASRILEAQVGQNPRIRVQQDAAFVPWNAILPEDSDDAQEWVRRTICCARWEINEAEKMVSTTDVPIVRLAVLAPDATAPIIATADATVSKHEPRAAGSLVSHWATRAGIKLLPVPPSVPNVGNIHNTVPSRPATQTKRRPGSGGSNHVTKGAGNLVERPAAAIALEGIVGSAGGPGVIRVLARGERLDSGP